MFVDAATRATAGIVAGQLEHASNRARDLLAEVGKLGPAATIEPRQAATFGRQLAGIDNVAATAARTLRRRPMTAPIAIVADRGASDAGVAAIGLRADLKLGRPTQAWQTTQHIGQLPDTLDAAARLARRIESGASPHAADGAAALARSQELLRRPPASLGVDELTELVGLEGTLHPGRGADNLLAGLEYRMPTGEVNPQGLGRFEEAMLVQRWASPSVTAGEAESRATELLTATDAATWTEGVRRELQAIAALDVARRPAWMPEATHELLTSNTPSSMQGTQATLLELRARNGIVPADARELALGVTTGDLDRIGPDQRTSLAATAMQVLGHVGGDDASSAVLRLVRGQPRGYVVPSGMGSELLEVKHALVPKLDADATLRRIDELAAAPGALRSPAGQSELGVLLARSRAADLVAGPPRKDWQVAADLREPLSAVTQGKPLSRRQVTAMVAAAHARASIRTRGDATRLLADVAASPRDRGVTISRMLQADLPRLRGRRAPNVSRTTLELLVAQPKLDPAAKFAAADLHARGLRRAGADLRVGELVDASRAGLTPAQVLELTAIANRYPGIGRTESERSWLTSIASSLADGRRGAANADEVMREAGYDVQRRAAELLRQLPADAPAADWSRGISLLEGSQDPEALRMLDAIPRDPALAPRSRGAEPRSPQELAVFAAEGGARIRATLEHLDAAVALASRGGIDASANRTRFDQAAPRLLQAIAEGTRATADLRAAGSSSAGIVDDAVAAMIDNVRRFERSRTTTDEMLFPDWSALGRARSSLTLSSQLVDVERSMSLPATI